MRIVGTVLIGWMPWLVADLSFVGDARAAGVDDWARSFADSEFVFQRQQSLVPFVPLAWAGIASYGNTPIDDFDGDEIGSYEQSTVSQALFVPIMLGRRDLLAVGEWVSMTSFDAESAPGRDLDVLSVAIPIGWARQHSDAWQFAAFVMPMGHRVTDHGGSWYWETMGGVFARYVPEGRWSWILGAFADVSPDEDFYVPYVGAGFQIDEHWQLSFVLPWPALLYAPADDWLLRFGVAPAGTSWSLDAVDQRVALDMDAWNLGLGVERRVWRSFWVRVEGGVSGFRGFGFVGGDWEGPNSSGGTSPYVSISVNFRPQGTSGYVR